MKKGTLIYNPVAGRRPAKREHEIRAAASILREAGLELELAPTERASMAHELAQAAVERGADVVFACGGDGTINEVINGLAPSQVPLAILPGGTANILAHELRIPLNPVGAARHFTKWSPRRIALGRARWTSTISGNGDPSRGSHARYFVCVAGVGYDAEVVYRLSPWLKKNFGVAGYVAEALRQFLTYPFPKFSCHLDGQKKQITFGVIHRTRLYAGWLHMAPTASLYGSDLAVCSFPSRSRIRYLVYASAVLLRQHLRLSDVSLDHCRNADCTRLESGDTIWFELDGELGGTLPATFEVVPDALTLMVP